MRSLIVLLLFGLALISCKDKHQDEEVLPTPTNFSIDFIPCEQAILCEWGYDVDRLQEYPYPYFVLQSLDIDSHWVDIKETAHLYLGLSMDEVDSLFFGTFTADRDRWRVIARTHSQESRPSNIDSSCCPTNSFWYPCDLAAATICLYVRDGSAIRPLLFPAQVTWYYEGTNTLYHNFAKSSNERLLLCFPEQGIIHLEVYAQFYLPWVGTIDLNTAPQQSLTVVLYTE